MTWAQREGCRFYFHPKPQQEPLRYPYPPAFPFTGPSLPVSRLIETLFGTGRTGDASTEADCKACTALTRCVVRCHQQQSMPYLMARSILPCLMRLSVSLAVPCPAPDTRPPQQTVPSLPVCSPPALWQYQESQVTHAGNQNSDPLQSAGHDRQPQGLLKQPEPPACHRLSCSSYSARGCIIFCSLPTCRGSSSRTSQVE